jgi:hypothetical protein
MLAVDFELNGSGLQRCWLNSTNISRYLAIGNNEFASC